MVGSIFILGVCRAISERSREVMIDTLILRVSIYTDSSVSEYRENSVSHPLQEQIL
jgi:hypothetical protein